MKQKLPTFTQFASACALSLLVGAVGYTVIANVVGSSNRPHTCGPRDGTQVRNLVQACFTYAVTTHQQSTEAEDEANDAMHAEAVVEPMDSHQPPNR